MSTHNNEKTGFRVKWQVFANNKISMSRYKLTRERK